ncbi:DUF2929 family protein [Lactiplantibacillus plantarum]|uniref:DUF2929 family protein n=1 Tax=Lactiplantibacillus plantarum TaxID=1590 RepID=UPI002556212A|nr:DUF2929 family protein [Lactiplantibacillus plantarum]
MKNFMANVVVLFWSVVFGEVLGMIGSKLELMTYQPLQIAIVAGILGLLFVNIVPLLTKN